MIVFTIKDYWKYSPMFPALCTLNDQKEYYNIENKDTHQYHDKIFRTILDDKKEFVWFVNHYLKLETTQKIRVENVEKYNRKFVTKKFKIRESDIIYKINNKDVFIVIEHQSTIDYNMPERITEYCIELIRSRKNLNIENKVTPLICPIVLYTGNKKWNAPLTLGENQISYNSFHQLNYPKYNLVDINDYSTEELLNDGTSISIAMLFEKLQTKQEFKEILDILLNKNLSKQQIEYIKLMLTHSNSIKKHLNEELDEYIKKFNKGDDYMWDQFLGELLDEKIQEGLAKGMAEGMAQGMAQGITQGITQGIAQGMAQSIKQVVKEMLNKNMDDELILDITKVTPERLAEFKAEFAT